MTARLDHPRVLVVAAAIPLLFLHAEFQPSVSIGLGGTSVTAYLSDFAVLAVVLAALTVLVREGAAPLRPGAPLWAAAAAFFAWIAFELFWGRHRAAAYPFTTHTVTALKFLEYALLAPALVLLVRTWRDLLVVLWAFVVWSCAATAVGVAQFFGAPIAAKGALGHRQASFLSSSDFAALSAGALLVGVIALALPRARIPRRLGTVAVVTGTLGTIIAGAMASVLGIAAALLAIAIVLRVRREVALRRAANVAAVALAVLAGAVAIRVTDLSAFASFVGSSTKPASPPAKVQTYSHRTLLAWIGWEMWKDHPLLGVGWEGSAEPVNFEPYLPAAHRRFPDESPLAFPARAPERHYGVQDIWLQALADLGVVGGALWVAVFGAAAWLAARTALRHGAAPALLALAWTALLLGLWSAQGFVAGIPLDALTWLAFGLAATRIATE